MPPEPSPPRLTRIVPESNQYGKTTYREAIKMLLGETGGRCGYSMEHVRDLGMRTMEVDHFNPTLKHPPRNQHGNLIAASRHCNGVKSQTWPPQEKREKGVRFLNPYEEQDYGEHIREDLETGMLVGVTPTGTWHIRMLDLNTGHLVLKRRDRTRLANSLKKCAYVSGADPSNDIYAALTQLLPVVKDTMLNTMIPPIPSIQKSKVTKKRPSRNA